MVVYIGEIKKLGLQEEVNKENITVWRPFATTKTVDLLPLYYPQSEDIWLRFTGKKRRIFAEEEFTMAPDIVCIGKF